MNNLDTLFANDGIIWLLAKALYVLAFTLYFIFTLIVWRQISLMARTLNSTNTLPLRLVGLLVSLIAFMALLTAIIIL